jgi:very-short-patch-repair endonuclease
MTPLAPSPSFLPPDSCLPRDRPFTRAEALDLVPTPRELTRLCGRGLLRRPVKGVYLATEAGDSPALRAAAIALVASSDCVVCDQHAAWLLGTTGALAPGEHLALRPLSLFRPSGHGRVRTGIVDGGERNLREDDVTTVHGVRVTTPLRTAHDLGRVRHPDRAIAGMDAVARLGHFSTDELLAGVERYARTRWVTTLREVAPLVDPRAESPAESVLRLRCLQVGEASFEPQVSVLEDGVEIARLDLANRDLRLAVEYDGEEWHSDPLQRERDRRRREYLTRVHGWTFVVVVRDDLLGPDQVELEARIRRAVIDARRRVGVRPLR